MFDTLTNGRKWALRCSGAFWLALVDDRAGDRHRRGPRYRGFFAALADQTSGSCLHATQIVPRVRLCRRPRGNQHSSIPIYYLANWVQTGPTALPLATLVNGQKTVVFQGMQHVASEDFYKSVVFDLEKALVDGYTLFCEGVQPVPGRPDLNEWFNKPCAAAPPLGVIPNACEGSP
jgi:hypothetical protein